MSTPRTYSQHTPGPWRLERPIIRGEQSAMADGTPYIEIKAGCGYAGTSESGFQFSSFMRPADSALILAAPDLLEALEMLMPQAPNNFADVDSYDRAMWEAARMAIAKTKIFPAGEAMTTPNLSPDVSVTKTGAGGELIQAESEVVS